MTSNQIAYWRNEEEKRTNRAKEAETARSNLAKEAETARHNLSDEDIRRYANELESRGLDLRQAEDVTKLVDIIAKYPDMEMSKIPEGVRSELSSMLGISDTTKDSGDSWLAKVMSTVKDGWNTIFGNKGIGNVGRLF